MADLQPHYSVDTGRAQNNKTIKFGNRRVTLSAKGAKMCTQAPAPAYTMCTQAPVPDWLGPVLNQSGVLKFAAGACIHNVYPGAGAWVHILAPFALSVTEYTRL